MCGHVYIAYLCMCVYVCMAYACVCLYVYVNMHVWYVYGMHLCVYMCA